MDMRRLTIIIAAAFVAASLIAMLVSSVRADDWQMVAPPGGGYTIKMPASPTLQHQTQPIAGGQVDTNMYIARLNGSIFVAGVTDYPVLVDVDRELSLDRDNFNKAVNATTLSQNDVTSNGVRGIQFVSSNGAQKFQGLWYTNGRRAWGIVCGMPVNSFDSTVVNRFLSSFEFTNSTG